MHRTISFVSAALVLLSSGSHWGNAQQPNDTRRQQAMAVVSSVLEETTVRQNGLFYVQFQLTALEQVAQQRGGFAPVVVAGAAVQPIPGGWIELTLEAPSGIIAGQVSSRIREYRVYEPGKGWTSAPLPIAWLSWKTDVRNDQFSVTSSTDIANQTAYGELTYFVAKIFNVSPANVKCSKPEPTSIPRADQVAPQKQWRARYGG